MQDLGNKLIEIHVTDSNLTTPGAGFFDDFGGMVDGLVATPALMVVLIALAVAVPLCILAITLSRLHHKRTGRSSVAGKTMLRITPIVAAAAIIATPLLTNAMINPVLLPNTPISITIDKATALSATDTTTVIFDQDATLKTDIYAQLDTDFNGHLGSNLTVSTANTTDLSLITNLSTTNNWVYESGPVAAGDMTDFNVTVNITEDLPIGDYVGQVSFYGQAVQAPVEKATVTFWCHVGAPDIKILQAQSDSVGVGDEILTDGGSYIGREVTLDVGSSYSAPLPNDLDLYGEECNRLTHPDGSQHDKYYWRANFPNHSMVVYAGEQMIATVSPVGAEPVPSDKVWYEQCWKDNNWEPSFCDQYDAEIDDYFLNTWLPWEVEYNNFDWQTWVEEFFDENGVLPVFDGVNFRWLIEMID